MGAFQYTALDPAGKNGRGVIEVTTARHVPLSCVSSSCFPSPQESATHEARRERRPLLGGGVSAADLSLMTRQLATLARAGLPLEEALLAVSQQTEKPRVQSVLIGVRSKVLEGHTLASGLNDFPRVFPEIYRATVAAGEQSGHLDQVLERLADYTESREQTRQKVRAPCSIPSC